MALSQEMQLLLQKRRWLLRDDECVQELRPTEPPFFHEEQLRQRKQLHFRISLKLFEDGDGACALEVLRCSRPLGLQQSFSLIHTDTLGDFSGEEEAGDFGEEEREREEEDCSLLEPHIIGF